jgi:hypothetical protein
MTRDEALAWFDTTEEVSPALASMTPATESVTRRAATESPMTLATAAALLVLVPFSVLAVLVTMARGVLDRTVRWGRGVAARRAANRAGSS